MTQFYYLLATSLPPHCSACAVQCLCMCYACAVHVYRSAYTLTLA